jgi:hypothetical protein
MTFGIMGRIGIYGPGKWSRLMRYAGVYKPDSEPLDQFIMRKGGINECAARFTRALGRGALRRTAD